MTPEALRNKVVAVGTRLYTPEKDSLPDGWWEALIEPHLEFTNRTGRQLTTAAPYPFGRKPGWVTMAQEGGGLATGLWCGDAQSSTCEVRVVMERIRRDLLAIVPLVRIWPAEPFDWLAKRGWTPQERERLKAMAVAA